METPNEVDYDIEETTELDCSEKQKETRTSLVPTLSDIISI